jgi:hypothetical protein
MEQNEDEKGTGKKKTSYFRKRGTGEFVKRFLAPGIFSFRRRRLPIARSAQLPLIINN